MFALIHEKTTRIQHILNINKKNSAHWSANLVSKLNFAVLDLKAIKKINDAENVKEILFK